MSISIYKEGDALTVRGVRCEIKTINPGQVEDYLLQGWHSSVKDLYSDKESIDTNESGKLSNEEVREAAKDKGIEGWEKKRIAKLKELLGV